MKVFKERPSDAAQQFLLPPSVNDFVPSDAPARILSEVVDGLDLSDLYAGYRGGGAPAYDPAILLKILLFGCMQGIHSSRRLATCLERDTHFMFLAGMSRPDFRTICNFRRKHEKAVKSIFKQVVQVCQSMGLVLLEHVAVDGTKIQANVSSKETYSAQRLEASQKQVDETIERLLKEMEAADAADDALLGEARGDELPKQLANAQERKKRLEQAKKDLERIGCNSVPATDTESRVMKTTSGNRPAYNAQAGVDTANQIIVAADVTQDQADNAQLPAVMKQTIDNAGFKPDEVSADKGYWSGRTLEYVEEQKLNAFLPERRPSKRRRTGMVRDAEADRYTDPTGDVYVFDCTRTISNVQYRVYRCRSSGRQFTVRQDGGKADRMRTKMATPEAMRAYALRKQTVEPVFGHIKYPLNLPRFLLRGLSGATIQYLLTCTAHNLGKLAPQWRQYSLSVAAS